MEAVKVVRYVSIGVLADYIGKLKIETYLTNRLIHSLVLNNTWILEIGHSMQTKILKSLYANTSKY